MIEPSDGATPLEYDEIKGVIPTHITTKGELDALELENIARAAAWMQAIKAENILNTDFICLLHRKMFGDVWKWAGKYRKAEKIFNKPPFSWGKTNLAETGDVRSLYISALKKADNYDYRALLEFARS